MAVDPRPCRGGCGTMTRRNSVRCVGCERRVKRKLRTLVSREASLLEDDGPDEETLKKTIAEQLAKPLPAWWFNSSRLAKQEHGEYVPRCIKLPQGFRRVMHDKNRRTDWY